MFGGIVDQSFMKIFFFQFSTGNKSYCFVCVWHPLSNEKVKINYYFWYAIVNILFDFM